MKTTYKNSQINSPIIIALIILINLFGIQNIYAQSFFADSLFGDNSTTRVDIRNSQNASVGAFITPDGNYITGGNTYTPGSNQVSVGISQVDRCGNPDLAFGRNGITAYRIGNINYISDLKLTPDGNISACGYESTTGAPEDRNPCIFLFTPFGNPDTYMNGRGSKIIYLPGSAGELETIHPLSGNKYLATGKCFSTSQNGNTGSFAVKLMPDGSPDPTFGINGIAFYNSIPLSATSSVLMPDGRIIIIAIGADPTPNILLFRSDSRGMLDHAFGSNGFMSTATTANTDVPKIKSIVADGNSFFFTAFNTPGNTPVKVQVMKFDFDGQVDVAFGNVGAFVAGGIRDHTLSGLNFYDNYLHVYGNAAKNGGSGFAVRVDTKGKIDKFWGRNGYFYPKLNTNGKHNISALLFHDSQDPIFTGSDQDFIYKKYTQSSKIPVITEQSGILVSSGAGTFQWFHNGNKINGATTPFYSPVLGGAYYVEFISNDGCTYTSLPYFWNQNARSTYQSGIEIYPNPAINFININLNDNADSRQSEIRIIDMAGRIMIHDNLNNSSTHHIDIGALAPAMYIVEIKNNSSINQTILYKSN